MHEGHRKRMYAKLDNAAELYDHEALEMLLYAATPRGNTNPLAHKLLNRFCSISEIFKADVKELMAVEGVGESIANFLKIVGICYEHAGNIEGAAVLKAFGDCKRFVEKRLRGKTEEYLELYFLEKNGKVKRILTYTSADRNKVVADAGELIREIALIKPFGILAAHNHLNGNVEPSENDENFTRQIVFICNMNGVKFWDHLIYSDGNFYSFNDDGRMEELSRKFSLQNAMLWINNSN